MIVMGWLAWASTSLTTLLRRTSSSLEVSNNELLKNKSELEARIAERSKQLQEAQAQVLQQEKMAAFGLLASEVEIISALIRATKLPQRPQTMLEQIICDADLDYLGRSDFPEISSLLYLELKTSGVVQSRNEWYKLQCEFLDKHAFHTSFSQTKHASGLNENRAFAKSLLDKHS